MSLSDKPTSYTVCTDEYFFDSYDISTVPRDSLNNLLAFGYFMGTEVNPYDVNKDGTVSIVDVIYMRSFLLGEDTDLPFENFDINGNGVVNVADFIKLRSYFLSN